MTTVRVPVSETISEFVAAIENEEFAGGTGLKGVINGETNAIRMRQRSSDSARSGAEIGRTNRVPRPRGQRRI